MPACSPKMERIVRAHIAEGSCVIVVADAETLPATEKEKEIRERHRLPPGLAEIIVVDPCMEALACIALGLRGCRSKPCKDGPLEAVNTYWARSHGRKYAKRFLPREGG